MPPVRRAVSTCSRSRRRRNRSVAERRRPSPPAGRTPTHAHTRRCSRDPLARSTAARPGCDQPGRCSNRLDPRGGPPRSAARVGATETATAVSAADEQRSRRGGGQTSQAPGRRNRRCPGERRIRSKRDRERSHTRGKRPRCRSGAISDVGTGVSSWWGRGMRRLRLFWRSGHERIPHPGTVR